MERWPIARMKSSAIRRPSPVLIIARDIKNAASTSQTTGSAYPASVDFILRVSMAFRSGRAGSVTVLIIASLSGIDFVKAIAATPSRTIAPPGAGRKIEPTMVATNIASKRHDCGVMPSGTGAR